MKQILLSFIIVFLVITACQKEKITFGTDVSDTFYLENNGSAMRILVEGNTLSKVLILFVPGGPGPGAYFYNTDYISSHIEDKYACVYWDERNSGASQGSSNGKNLTLDQMTNDLKKVIQLLKIRYGQDCSVYLLGHSFGGLLTSSFMTTGNNQTMVKGWIFADGSQNYPLNDTLTRHMLMTFGNQQISQNKNTAGWNEIISYCNSHTGPFSLEESDQLQTYAMDAETYIDSVPKINEWTILKNNALKYNWPLTSMLMNYLYSSKADLNDALAKTEFSSSLNRITAPVLILFGNYDFVCPKGLGYDLFYRISSSYKKIVISPFSGHNIMLQDEMLFCNEINEFVDSTR
jgi:pimeloyl-ACP methyl ester carboxylesterase